MVWRQDYLRQWRLDLSDNRGISLEEAVAIAQCDFGYFGYFGYRKFVAWSALDCTAVGCLALGCIAVTSSATERMIVTRIVGDSQGTVSAVAPAADSTAEPVGDGTRTVVTAENSWVPIVWRTHDSNHMGQNSCLDQPERKRRTGHRIEGQRSNTGSR